MSISTDSGGLTTPIATSSFSYGPYYASETASSASSTFTGSDEYRVFPNGAYLSRFYLVSSSEAGLTELDIDLYNFCYLPYNPLPYNNYRKRSPQATGDPRPDYELEAAPCKRTASINANCYIENTNGTFSGLRDSEQPDAQQQCFCDVYPFFDSVRGCMECFRQHGGIEGYHWFPQSYVNAVSSSYCAADPQSTLFYDFARDWAKTNPAAKVPSTTAENVLGTQTAASLYYTYAAAMTDGSSEGSAPQFQKSSSSTSLRHLLLATIALSLVAHLV